jgi:hypothetical protein
LTEVAAVAAAGLVLVTAERILLPVEPGHLLVLVVAVVGVLGLLERMAPVEPVRMVSLSSGTWFRSSA